MLKKLLERHISNSKIRKQLTVVYLVAILIPTLIVSFFLLFYVKTLLVRQNSQLLESDVSRIKSILVEVTAQVINYSDEIVTDFSKRNNLLDPTLSKTKLRQTWDNYDQLDNYIWHYAFIDDIEVYYDGPNIMNHKQLHKTTKRIRASSWYQKSVNNASPFWEIRKTDDNLGNSSWHLYLIRKLQLAEANNPAILAIRVSDNYFRNRILNTDYGVIISNNLTNSIAFSSDRNLYGCKDPVIKPEQKDFYQYTGILNIDGKKNLCSTSTLPSINNETMFYITSIDYNAYKYIYRILFICMMILMITILVPIPISSIYGNVFTSRVNTLRTQMAKASTGDYNIIPTFEGDDELKELFNNLQVMVEDIKAKEACMYESKITEQKLINQQHIMEYKALASQINPHFLYNALETIRMKAFTTGDREVATAIKLLGKSMRYVLDNTGTNATNLKKELDYIDIYIQIQKLRFGDRINYSLEVEEGLDLEECSILPLLLQPLVENAISHGIEHNVEPGHLNLSVRSDKQSYLFITICDDGLGMDAETLATLKEQIRIPNKAKTVNIGLYNIYQRIKLCYGDAYDMLIQSKQGEGTTITLRLPLNTTFHI